MGDALLNRLSDRGSIPLRSTEKGAGNDEFPAPFLLLSIEHKNFHTTSFGY